ncbi:MAG: VWA domain-containing protein [Cyanobacteriota bacterium]
MRFGNIEYFLFFIIIPFISFFYYKALKTKEKKIYSFINKKILDKIISYNWKKRFIYRAIILNTFLVLCIFSLARPQYGFREEEIKKRGAEIVVAVDLSKSMNAQDIKPTRLDRAKMKLNDLLKTLQGDKIALVAFAGTSFLQCPLTLDYEAFQIFLDYLDTDLIPVPGTSIGNALETAVKAFPKDSSKNKSIILITDGEDQENLIEPLMNELKEKKIRVFSIGIGKEEGVPIPDQNGFKLDENGKIILTKLDEKTLKNLSEKTGGTFIRSVSGDIDVKKIYELIKSSGEDKDFTAGKKYVFEDRFQIFLSLGLILLIIEFLL